MRARRRDRGLVLLGDAQYVRLAWSIDAGRPVERPSVVACRYSTPC